jgi:mono/diheme cytochrome c family protein
MPFRRHTAALMAGLALASAAADEAGPGAKDVAALYNTHCAGCHGKDGRARTPMAKKLKVRDLTKSKATDAEIERQIREGKQGPKGETLMPAFKGRLTDDEIKQLIEKVKKFRN